MSSTGSSKTERNADRRRVLKAGVIAYNGRHVTLQCGVRDLSTLGARLQVVGSVSAPDTFELLMDLDGLEASCEVVWRGGAEIGVRFLEPPRVVDKKREQVVHQWSATSQRPSLRRKPLPSRSTT